MKPKVSKLKIKNKVIADKNDLLKRFILVISPPQLLFNYIQIRYQTGNSFILTILLFCGLSLSISEFGDDAELIKQLVNEALKQVKDKDNPTLIQKSLAGVSDIAIRVSSGVISFEWRVVATLEESYNMVVTGLA